MARRLVRSLGWPLALAVGVGSFAASCDSSSPDSVDSAAIAELWPAHGGGGSEVDPTSSLAETVRVADAIAVGRVASVTQGPSYGTDPTLGNIDYAIVEFEAPEKIKDNQDPIRIMIPMYGEKLESVRETLDGLRLLVFLRDLEVDARREGRSASTSPEADYFRILNMHGLVLDDDGRANRPWSSEEFQGAPNDFEEMVSETRRLARGGRQS